MRTGYQYRKNQVYYSPIHFLFEIQNFDVLKDSRDEADSDTIFK